MVIWRFRLKCAREKEWRSWTKVIGLDKEINHSNA